MRVGSACGDGLIAACDLVVSPAAPSIMASHSIIVLSSSFVSPDTIRSLSEKQETNIRREATCHASTVGRIGQWLCHAALRCAARACGSKGHGTHTRAHVLGVWFKRARHVHTRTRARTCTHALTRTHAAHTHTQTHHTACAGPTAKIPSGSDPARFGSRCAHWRRVASRPGSA